MARKLTKYGLPTPTPYFGQGDVVVLKKNEIQPFQVVAGVKDSYVEWEIEARVVVDGEEREITIDNNGEPFRQTGTARKGGYSRYYEWVWYEQPPYLYAGNEPKP